MNTKSALEQLVPEELYESYLNNDTVNHTFNYALFLSATRERALIQCVLSLVEQNAHYKTAYTEAMKLSPGRPIIIYSDPEKTDADL